MDKRNQLNLITRGATVAALIVVLAGCAKSRDELNQYIADVKARPEGPVDPLPIMKTFETFIYDAHALRECIIQLAPYAGYPAISGLVQVTEQVIAEHAKEKA